MDTLACKPVLSNLTKGGKPCYQLYVKNSKIMSQSDFCEKISSALDVSMAKARLINDVLGQIFAAEVLANKNVNTGWLRGHLTVEGSIPTMGAKTDPKNNPVKAVLLPLGDFKAAVDGVLAVNDVVVINSILYTVQYGQSTERNTIEGTSEDLKINGDKIAINTDMTDEGVWLEDAEGTMVTDKATIVSSSTNTINCRFATLPEDGIYTLVIATRNGESSADYGVNRLTRQVEVITAA